MNTESVPVSSEQQRAPERVRSSYIREEAFPFGYLMLPPEEIQIGAYFQGKLILGSTILENGTTYRSPGADRLYQMVSLFLRDDEGEETETHIVLLLEGFS